MLPRHKEDRILFPESARPHLVVIVDAEEEFDWKKPFSRNSRSVLTAGAQGPAHRIFERFNVVPTYAVDYPVASQPEGYRPLRELMEAGLCDIGAQLHTWVTPPYEEEVCERNSFAGNLAASLERSKIAQLTGVIEENFGRRPRLYRAGRYGAGRDTARFLAELGYQIDCSVLPGGPPGAFAPDYSGATAHPYWLSRTGAILEIPVTVATLGFAGEFGDRLYETLASPLGRRLRVPAIMARLGAMERIRLTPEGTNLREAKRLTRRMYETGHRVFAISYHSPSLVPGNTQYVHNARELKAFLDWLEGYLDFFFGELQGQAATPGEVRD
jgi:hypothetical protein